VTHRDIDGREIVYDFGLLPVAPAMARSLAALFAAKCHPDIWSSHATSRGIFQQVRSFTAILAALARPPRDLEELTASMVEGWWEQSRSQVLARDSFRYLSSLLRTDPRLSQGPVADALSRRVSASTSQVQSFLPDEREAIRTAARAGLRRALLRIEGNAAHLQRYRAGVYAAEPDGREAVIGEFLDRLARTGALPHRRSRSGSVHLPDRYLKALGGGGSGLTWQRLFPSSMEAAALAVELAFAFGWNLATLNHMPAPRPEPGPGIGGPLVYRVEIAKRRRGRGYWFDTENIADTGAGSGGRLITNALALTRFARALVEQDAPGTDFLLTWRAANAPGRPGKLQELPAPVGRFNFGIASYHAKMWAESQGLPAHSPFRRARRTAVAIDHRTPIGHTPATHERVYLLPDKQVRQEAVDVFAAGAETAVEAARTVVLEAVLRDRHEAGDVETATADCADFEHGPYPAPGGGCGASFLMCLGCTNARIHPGHHPRLAYLHQALSNLRSSEHPAAWTREWGDAHARLEHLRRELGDTRWQHARAQVTARDREMIGHLLSGDLGA
jgi:hypothetical protein